MCKKIIAITGPSGAGKTTLTKKLLEDYGFAIPRHTTTRMPRDDDENGFYRYISLKQFEEYMTEGAFLIASSDGVKGYGILKSDCEDAWCFSDTIVLNISYKDIENVSMLPYDIKMVVLTFQNIQDGIMSRIASGGRAHSADDIKYRIDSAKEDFRKYFPALKRYNATIAYTDTMNEKETYDFVRTNIKLTEKTRITNGTKFLGVAIHNEEIQK